MQHRKHIKLRLLSSWDLKDVKLSLTMRGGQLDALLTQVMALFFSFFDLINWTKGATFAPLNTKASPGKQL